MTRVADALSQHTYDSLYVKESDLIPMQIDGVLRPDISIGDGLFCSMLLPSSPQGIKVASFLGDTINEDMLAMKEAKGEGGYVVKVHDKLIDCYRNAMTGRCKSSKANSALNCFNNREQKNAKNNCTLRNGALWTMPNTTIPPNRELLWAYSRGYTYPSLKQYQL